MKKILMAALLLVSLQGCAVCYTYSEVDNIEMANFVSMFDTKVSRRPARVVAAYPDSTGRVVYLVEEKVRLKELK